MKHLFIVNPVAGKGKTLNCIPQIENFFKNNKASYCIEVTERPGHSISIVKNHLHESESRVYSVGGDGTLNEILNGMIGRIGSLGIIPKGSGNDFIKSLGVSYKSGDIMERTIKGREIPVDIGRVNGRYFINIASVGFDAEVAHNAVKYKKLPFIPGSLAYILSTIITAIRKKNNLLEIKIDDQLIKTNILLVAIANGKYYGGGVMPAPEASLDDGMFDICLVEDMPVRKILRFLPKYINGQHKDIDGVHFFRSRNVSIRSNTDIVMNIDGEIEIVKNAVFEIIPKGINIIFPQDILKKEA